MSEWANGWLAGLSPLGDKGGVATDRQTSGDHLSPDADESATLFIYPAIVSLLQIEYPVARHSQIFIIYFIRYIYTHTHTHRY